MEDYDHHPSLRGGNADAAVQKLDNQQTGLLRSLWSLAMTA